MLNMNKHWSSENFLLSYLYVWLSLEYSMVDDFDLVTATLLLEVALVLAGLPELACIILAALVWLLWLFLLLKFSMRGAWSGLKRPANPKWFAKLGWCSVLSLFRLSWSNWSLVTGLEESSFDLITLVLALLLLLSAVEGTVDPKKNKNKHKGVSQTCSLLYHGANIADNSPIPVINFQLEKNLGKLHKKHWMIFRKLTFYKVSKANMKNNLLRHQVFC